MQVQVAPLEPHQLSLSKPCLEGHEENRSPLGLGQEDQPLGLLEGEEVVSGLPQLEELHARDVGDDALLLREREHLAQYAQRVVDVPEAHGRRARALAHAEGRR